MADAAPAVRPRSPAHFGAPTLADDALRAGMRALPQPQSHPAVQRESDPGVEEGIAEVHRSH
jgi:hypothetical protein